MTAPPEGPDFVRLAAEIIAHHPEIWRGLAAAHVPDQWGRCAGCASQVRNGPVWGLCALAAVAGEARRLYHQQRTRSALR